jgi:tetratricopeptide (TPR) repeat protein
MAVGLLIGEGFNPSSSDLQELLDRGLINTTGFEFVTLELSPDRAANREALRELYEAACIKQGWEAGRLFSPLLTFAEVLVGGKPAIIVRPEGSEDEGWLRIAAQEGDAKAMVALGVAAGEEGDLATAHAWYERAAAKGNGDAMFNLGADAYQRGDSNAARDWFARAADAGLPKAMFNLGVFAHQDGDRKTARSWLQRAADAGDGEARAALAAYPSD